MKNEVITLLSKLVSIKSPYFEEDEIMDFVYHWFSEKGLPVELHQYHESKVTGFNGKNLIVDIQGGGDGPTIGFNGHLDTVQLCEGWTHKPYGEIVDDRLYGVGALDMKSGCAATMVAIEQFVKDYPKFNGRIVTSYVSVEEGPYGMGTNALIEDGRLDGIDYFICTEPSAGFTREPFPTICLGARGGYGLQVEFYGKSAHAANPHLGVSAAYDAAKFVTEIEKVTYIVDDKLGKGTACVIALDSDGGACSVPDKAIVKLFWHIVRGESPETIELEIEKALKRADVKCRYEIKFREAPSEGSKGFMPYVTDGDDDLTISFTNAVSKVTGKKPTVSYFQSIGDFNYLGSRLPGPTIIFGADGQDYHGADEYATLESVKDTTEIIYEFLVDTLTK